MGILNKPKITRKQIPQILLLIVTVVAFIFSIILVRYVFVEVTGAIESVDPTNTKISDAYDTMNGYFVTLDYGVLFILIGLTIVLLITSFFIPTHSVFLIINIIGIVVLAIVAGVLSNVYGEFIEQPGINDTMFDGGSEVFAKSTFVMTKLPWICTIIILLSTIIMYAKGRQDGTYG